MAAAINAGSHTGRRKRPLVPVDLRQRVGRACDRCRLRKQKCDGQLECRRCAGTRKQCVYSEHEQASQPESFTGEEGSFQAPTIDDQRANKESIILGKSFTPDNAVAVHSQGKTHFHSGSSHFAFFDSAYDAMRNDDPSGGFSGGKAVGFPVSTPFQVLNRLITLQAYHHFVRESASSQSQYDQDTILDALPPRQVVEFLSTIFFQHAQANFFYIHPEIFKRKLENFYANRLMQRTTAHANTVEFTCVLFMILAIGSQFADLGVEKENETLSGTLAEGETQTLPNPGWRFYEVARKMLPDVILSSSMTSIQACVLQGVFLFSTDARDVCYNVLGLALRTAINMGMHRSVVTENLHPHVRELRNRLWWSTYTAERLFAVEMGRPLAIDDSDIDTPFPTDIPALRVHGTDNNFDHLIAMVKLCQTMGKIVRLAYPRATSGKRGMVVQPSRFRQLRAELQEWESDLPRCLRLSQAPSRAVAHIHLTLQQARILLTRACLNHAATQQLHEDLSLEAKHFLHENAEECLLAASKTVQIMVSLLERSLICRFSFHDFLYCSTALYVLLLGAKLHGLDEAAKRVIIQGLSVLSALSKGSDAADASLSSIRQGYQTLVKDSGTEPWSDKTAEQQARKAWLTWLTRSQPFTASEQHVAPVLEHAQHAADWESSGDFILAAPSTAETVDQMTSLWIPALDTSHNFLGEELASTPNWDVFDH